MNKLLIKQLMHKSLLFKLISKFWALILNYVKINQNVRNILFNLIALSHSQSLKSFSLTLSFGFSLWKIDLKKFLQINIFYFHKYSAIWYFCILTFFDDLNLLLIYVKSQFWIPETSKKILMFFHQRLNQMYNIYKLCFLSCYLFIL